MRDCRFRELVEVIICKFPSSLLLKLFNRFVDFGVSRKRRPRKQWPRKRRPRKRCPRKRRPRKPILINNSQTKKIWKKKKTWAEDLYKGKGRHLKRSLVRGEPRRAKLKISLRFIFNSSITFTQCTMQCPRQNNSSCDHMYNEGLCCLSVKISQIWTFRNTSFPKPLFINTLRDRSWKITRYTFNQYTLYWPPPQPVLEEEGVSLGTD